MGKKFIICSESHAQNPNSFNPKNSSQTSRKRAEKGNWKALIWVVFALIFLSLGSSLLYNYFVKRDESGEVIAISDPYRDRFLEDSAKLNHCVQYALVAGRSAWYGKCVGEEKIYLNKGEIWKYGITCEENPETRYSQDFYIRTQLQFIVQFRGTLLECTVEEKRKLYQYPALPENIKRPEKDRLILPAGNCKRQ